MKSFTTLATELSSLHGVTIVRVPGKYEISFVLLAHPLLFGALCLCVLDFFCYSLRR